MIPGAALLSRFQSDLDALAPREAKLGVAVSGGADSLALLLLAAAARPGQVEAVTVDHGLRPEGASESAMVAGVCARVGAGHSALRLEDLKASDGNLQARARDARYRLIGEWAADRGVSAVATAHHLDDQAETLLMRVARGSGVGGLAAIQPSRPLTDAVRLIRPVLGWRAEELRRIVDEAGLTPVRDPSNQDSRFDRTRARELLASVDWLDPARLAAVAANAADAERALDWAANDAFQLRATSEGAVLILDPTGLPRELRRRLLVRGLETFQCTEPPGPQLMQAMAILEGGGTTTIAGLKLEGGAQWRLSAAPPRRDRESAPKRRND